MASQLQNRVVPEVVYASDGTKYYPCSYCCRAFAHKRYLTLHMRACVKNELKNRIGITGPIQPAPVRKQRKKRTNQLGGARTIDLTDDEVKPAIFSGFHSRVSNNNKDAMGYSSHSLRYSGDVAARNLLRLPESTSITVAGMEMDVAPPPNVRRGAHQVRRYGKRQSVAARACKICATIFDDMDELVMHAKIEHNQRSNSEKRMFPPEELEYFYMVFLKSDKTSCPICGKPIGNKLNWKRHLYTHSSVKKFECQVCRKTFSRSDHCRYHEQRHKIKTEPMVAE